MGPTSSRGDGKAACGVVGLGVMGAQLVLNLAEKLQQTIAGFDLDESKVSGVMKLAEEQGGLPVQSFTALEEFVGSLSVPRRIMLLVPAGKPVEGAISSLMPMLQAKDVIVDFGNEWYENTEERQRRLDPTGIVYIGCGLSGGEYGARHGPCLMPGGGEAGWQLLKPLFESIAAKVQMQERTLPCVRYIGPGGAGHYVKMVHNGIEYGDMQLISEAAHFCRAVGGLKPSELAALFSELNKGALDCFLMETTAACFLKADDQPNAPAGAALIDALFDSCGSKGTGKWTVKQAAELGVGSSTHAAALDARYLSSLKSEREAASKLLGGPSAQSGAAHQGWQTDMEDALLASKLCSYAQGMAHLRAASDEFGWKLKLDDLATIWQGGCIIRAKVLNLVRTAYEKQPTLPNLLLDPTIAETMAKRAPGWRRFVLKAIEQGLPVPAMSASLSYYDTLRHAVLPSAQCVQAQRDCFGGHGFKRLDAPGTFHAIWMERGTSVD